LGCFFYQKYTLILQRLSVFKRSQKILYVDITQKKIMSEFYKSLCTKQKKAIERPQKITQNTLLKIKFARNVPFYISY
jgi:hypothetical protein